MNMILKTGRQRSWDKQIIRNEKFNTSQFHKTCPTERMHFHSPSFIMTHQPHKKASHPLFTINNRNFESASYFIQVEVISTNTTIVRNALNIMVTLTYCNVESNARRFPSFPLDHLLTSASKVSANLCKQNYPR